MIILLIISVGRFGQINEPPRIDEVFRQLPTDEHARDYLRIQPIIVKPSSVCAEYCSVNIDGKVLPVYRVGGGVTPPRAVKASAPHYAEQAQKAKYQGTVVLFCVIGPDGVPYDVRVARSLGLGLDEEARNAVRKWRFRPAMKDGNPVAVMVNIEVNFKLGN
ncbi:MAG: energy transducer TonB [Terriglobales bacterium]